MVLFVCFIFRFLLTTDILGHIILYKLIKIDVLELKKDFFSEQFKKIITRYNFNTLRRCADL